MDTPTRTDTPSQMNATPASNATRTSLSIAIAGSGGSGVMTAGTLLLDAAARAGLVRPDGTHQRPADPGRRSGRVAAPGSFAAGVAGRPVRPVARHRLAQRAPFCRRDPLASRRSGHWRLRRRGSAHRCSWPAARVPCRCRSRRWPRRCPAAGSTCWRSALPAPSPVCRWIAWKPPCAMDGNAARARSMRTCALYTRACRRHQTFPASRGWQSHAAAHKPCLRAGRSAATRRPATVPCAGACASSLPTRSRRPPNCSNGWHRHWDRSAAH